MRQLIYDVGMHNGDDSAYYLAKGYEVVGIDANPNLCAACTIRFEREIAEGRMTVLNTGVGPAEDRMIFHINERESQLSSFVAPVNSNDSWLRIRVPVRRLSSIIAEHGPAHYIKIDVEHFDHLILAELEQVGLRPSFISAEAHHPQTLAALLNLGYRRFKLVEGVKVPVLYGQRSIATLSGAIVDHSFPPLSSGPFGDDLDGPWLDAQALSREIASVGWGWIDIHAAA